MKKIFKYGNTAKVSVLRSTAMGALLAGICLTTGMNALSQTTTPRPNDVYAINAGGGAIDGWTADSNFYLGNTYTNDSQPVSLAGLPQDDAPPAVYQDQREGGHFSYIFTGLQPTTTYQVTLHFAELYWQLPNQRKFNVTINGTPELPDYDIVANAGGPFKAIAVQLFVATDASGELKIDFTRGSMDQPVVNAIEVATRLNG